VTLVSHEPAQGAAASGSAGRPRRPASRKAARRRNQPLRLDTLKQARPHQRGTRIDRPRSPNLLHLHSNGLIIEVAAAVGDAPGHSVRPHALRHGDSGTTGAGGRLDSVHARVSRRRAVTFYSRKLMERAIELGLDPAIV
jgi:hypothetical protein